MGHNEVIAWINREGRVEFSVWVQATSFQSLQSERMEKSHEVGSHLPGLPGATMTLPLAITLPNEHSPQQGY